MSDSPGQDDSEYEKETRKKFWLGATAYWAWRDYHRSVLAQLLADPRVSEEARQAIREKL